MAPVLVSRVLVWGVGIVAALARTSRPDDLVGTVSHLGSFGNTFWAPAARWDAVWYLEIAEHGYAHSSPDFYPLYPLSIRALAAVTRSPVLAGVLISMVLFVLAMVVVHRLVALDYGPRIASLTVWVLALFPMSLFFSAVYTESMFLAFSVGSIYAARRRHWAIAGVLGGLASATRNVGLLLVVPLLLLYLEDRHEHGEGAAGSWRQVAWIALVPCGVLGYVIGLGISSGTPFAMFNAAPAGRGFVLPPVTVVRQVQFVIHAIQGHAPGAHAGLNPLHSGLDKLAFLVLAIVAAVGAALELSRPYAAYAIVSLLAILSEPDIVTEPLTSFDRYTLVVFPLWIWAAIMLARTRYRVWILAASAVLLAVYTAQFATWRFVA